MAHVFLSYSTDDVRIAEQLATALGGNGWSVFWDRKVPPGQRWEDVLERELDAANCVVVLWSKASVASRWVREEASEALEMAKLIPARIDGVKLPLGYRAIEAADLREWTPGSPGQEYDQLVAAVTGLVEQSTAESRADVLDPVTPLWSERYDPGTLIEVDTLEGHTNDVNGVAVTPDGRHVLSASDDETVKVWELASGDEVRTLTGHDSWVYKVAVTPDGRHLLSGSADETVKVWDLASGNEVRTLEGHTDQVFGVAVTPDGRHVLSASDDETVKVWDLASGDEVRTLEGHTDEVNGVAVTPNGSHVLSGSADETVKVWDLASGDEVRTLRGHTGKVYGVAVTPDGSHVLSGSSDQTVKVWLMGTYR